MALNSPLLIFLWHLRLLSVFTSPFLFSFVDFLNLLLRPVYVKEVITHACSSWHASFTKEWCTVGCGMASIACVKGGSDRATWGFSPSPPFPVLLASIRLTCSFCCLILLELRQVTLSRQCIIISSDNSHFLAQWRTKNILNFFLFFSFTLVYSV